MKKSWIIGGIIALVLILWGVSSYNGMVTSKRGIDGAWGQVQVVLQRRLDLIPQLVATVKGSAKFEQSTLQNIAAARSGLSTALSSGDRGQQVAAAQQLDNVMYQFRVQVEQYPQLQAVKGFSDLSTQLEGTENRIAVERKRYNDAILEYNIKTSTFPAVIMARLFGFAPEKQYTAPVGADTAPVVNFDDTKK